MMPASVKPFALNCSAKPVWYTKILLIVWRGVLGEPFGGRLFRYISRSAGVVDDLKTRANACPFFFSVMAA